MKRTTTPLLAALILMLAAGCGIYSVSGSLPSHIKTCAVPLFRNDTVEVGIVEELTKEITSAVIRDGSMKVVGEFQADAVVNGTIVDVIEEADTYTREEAAKKFKVRVIADVTFFDRKKNRTIWEEKGLEGWALFESGDLNSREKAVSEASAMLAKLIIDKTVSGW